MTSSPSPDISRQFLALVKQRCSCRSYDPDRAVPREAIEYCLEAARLAPSACNRQPWRFIVVEDADTREAIFAAGRLPGVAHTWWQNVPVFVVLCAKLDLIAHRLAPAVSNIPYYLLDLGIAGEHFVLAATELGLGTCWIGWFREKTIKNLLGIPRGVRILSLITLGYPAGKQGREPTTGVRADMENIAFWNQWGHRPSDECAGQCRI